MNQEIAREAKRKLDAAVLEYERAIMRTPTNEEEIRRAVDKCVAARTLLDDAQSDKLSPKTP
jgi:hypothetical protein